MKYITKFLKKTKLFLNKLMNNTIFDSFERISIKKEEINDKKNFNF